MKYLSTLIAVSDMAKSRQFYHDVLGLGIASDFGANVTLEGGVALQTIESWKYFIETDTITLPNHAGELYFEEEDMDAVVRRFIQQGLSEEETAARMDVSLDYVISCMKRNISVE